MKGDKQTKEQLLNELAELRRYIAELEKSENKGKRIREVPPSSENSIENIVFEDLFNLPDLQLLQDNLAYSWGVAMLLTRPDGTAITSPSNFTNFCQFIRVTEKGFKNCQKSDAELGRYNPYGPTIHKCLSAGLWGAGASITAGGRQIANWLIGQVRNEAQSEEEILKYARELGIDETAFSEAFLQVPVMPQEKFEQIACTLFALANQLSNIAYQNIQQAHFIAERKRVEKALRESEERFRGIYEESPLGIELYDRNGVLLDVNRACLDIFGISDAEAVKGVQLFENPHLKEDCKAQLRRGETVRLEIPYDFGKITACNLYKTTKSGIIYLLVLITPLRGGTKEFNIGYLVHTRDITDRKQAEYALRESEKKYRRLHESMTEAFVIVDMKGRIQESNHAYQSMLGYSEEELRHLTYSDLTPAKWHALEKSIIEDQIMVHGYSNVYEKEYQRKDGSVFPVELSTFLIRDEAGNPVSMWAIAHDITERKQAEAALKESEEKYNQFFRTSRDCVFITKDGSLIDINDAAVELLGYSSREELLPIRVPDLYANPEEWRHHADVVSEFGYSKEYPVDFRKKDGSIRHTLVTSAARYDAKGDLIGFQGTVRDVTGQRQNEEELRKYREKLEVLVAERTRELEDKTKNLEEVNTALNVLLKKRENDRKLLEENFVANIGSLVLPYLEKIRKNNLDAQQKFFLDTIEKNLDEIGSPLLKNIHQFNLTPREIQIASLIKDGKTTKEIATALGIVEGSISTHRKNIRKKLGLGRTSNLQSQLRFFEK
jgi:PAS domain S-box-containing protein